MSRHTAVRSAARRSSRPNPEGRAEPMTATLDARTRRLVYYDSVTLPVASHLRLTPDRRLWAVLGSVRSVQLGVTLTGSAEPARPAFVVANSSTSLADRLLFEPEVTSSALMVQCSQHVIPPAIHGQPRRPTGARSSPRAQRSASKSADRPAARNQSARQQRAGWSIPISRPRARSPRRRSSRPR